MTPPVPLGRDREQVIPTPLHPSPVTASVSEWSGSFVAASASDWSARLSRAPIDALQRPIALRLFALFVAIPFRLFRAASFPTALAALTLFAPSAHAATPTPADLDFFESKIRPILIDSCYKCHNAAEGKTKGSLALDTREGLLKGGATGPGLLAGDPDKSLLIQAIRYTDEDLQMPPLKDGEGGKLPPEKIALLEEWVRRGAPDPRTGPVVAIALDMTRARQHWAFQPLPAPTAPKIGTQQSAVANPIDALVRPKLAAAKLTPAPAADARTLLRRVTYDLTGLPPNPEEMDSFLRDFQPAGTVGQGLSLPSVALDAAYTRAVDRLLASPRYGERWGRHWLDIARYADTQGYLVGNAERRFAYSHTYRDYVIRAFNTDLPFDRFIHEQLAADQLPLGDDKSPLAAMGFLTLGRRFLGNQNDIIDDRIDVVTRGFLGLTVACARCHDHKFDPIPARDYYALHGIFASSEEPAEKPLLARLDETAPAYREFLRKRAEIEAKVEAKKHELVDTFLADQRKKTGDYLLGAHDAAKLPPGEKLDLFAGARKLNPEILKRWQKYLADHAAAPGPVLAPWFARQKQADVPAPSVAELHTAATAPSSSPDGPTAPRATPTALLAHLASDSQPSTLSSQLSPPDISPALLAALKEKPPASLKDLAALYNQVFTAAEKSAPAVPVEQALSLPFDAPPPSSVPSFPSVPSAPSKPTPALDPLHTFLTASDSPTALGFEETAKMLKRQIDDKISGFRREIEALNWTEPGAPLRAMALVDKPNPKNSPIFLRGNPANKGPEAPRRFLEVLAPSVSASDPAAVGQASLLASDSAPHSQLSALNSQLGSFTATKSSGRIELARAITGPAAPLTARVLVNRVWGWHFGQPLVRTPSDFGVRTAPPVQRDLLDALAATFVADGWSLKKLHRTILLSATYRQSATASPAALAADPDNLLLGRFTPHRLEFEALRDTLLAVSGRLDLAAGGIPDDLTKEPFTRRRTVYGFIDRQNLPGMFRTFDFPNPDTTSAQRFATTVPQQSLFLLNSPFALEQARHLAQRLTPARTDADKIRLLYRTLYQRAPDADEISLAQSFLTTAKSGAQLSALNSHLPAPGWSYGTGAYDSATHRTRDFTPLTHRTLGTGKQKDQVTRLSPSAKYPDPTHGALALTPAGGHPGSTPARAAILRWIAPADGLIQIEATLAHPTDKGDGIAARLISSQQGTLGEWTVHNTKAETKFTDLRVTAGETFDFLVESRATANSDGYTWSPKITYTADSDSSQRIWESKRDFGTVEKPRVPLTPLESLAQVLLLSNELAFVD